MKKRIWFLTMVCALLSGSGGVALGGHGTQYGENDDEDIAFDRTATQITARGSLGTARSEAAGSGNEDKWIGCWVDSSAGGSMVTCWAVSSLLNESVRCSATDAPMVAAVAGMNGDSKVSFTVDASSSPIDGSTTATSYTGRCRSIKVENFSYYNVKS